MADYLPVTRQITNVAVTKYFSERCDLFYANINTHTHSLVKSLVAVMPTQTNWGACAL